MNLLFSKTEIRDYLNLDDDTATQILEFVSKLESSMQGQTLAWVKFNKWSKTIESEFLLQFRYRCLILIQSDNMAEFVLDLKENSATIAEFVLSNTILSDTENFLRFNEEQRNIQIELTANLPQKIYEDLEQELKEMVDIKLPKRGLNIIYKAFDSRKTSRTLGILIEWKDRPVLALFHSIALRGTRLNQTQLRYHIAIIKNFCEVCTQHRLYGNYEEFRKKLRMIDFFPLYSKYKNRERIKIVIINPINCLEFMEGKTNKHSFFIGVSLKPLYVECDDLSLQWQVTDDGDTIFFLSSLS